MSCSYDAAAHTVTAVSDTATGSFLRVGLGGELLADGAQCLSPANVAATTLNTDTVLIGATGDTAAVGIDLSGGPFTPGFTDEPGSASDEIELVLDLPGDSLPAVLGTAGEDWFVVGAGGINMNAAEPDDEADVNVGPGTPTVTLGGAGANDRLSSAGGEGTGGSYAGATLHSGGDGNDRLIGGSARDVMFGGPEFDILAGGGGDDALDGGADEDWADYETAPAGVVATLPGGTAPGADGYGTTDTYVSIERLRGSAFDDVLTGDDLANVVFAGDGNDLLSGGGGNDSIRGWRGNDVVDGGPGDDGLSGDPGDDTLTSGDDDDELADGAGRDKVEGQSGDDRLIASGWDPDFGFTLGPSGTDYLSGGSGIDTVTYLFRPAGLRISLDGVANDGEPGENDQVGPAGDVENVEGGEGADLIVGNNGSNVLDGLRGNDQLVGLGQGDTLIGGTGSDIALGGAGTDRLLLEDGTSDFGVGGVGTDTAEADPFDLLLLVELVL